MHHHRTLLTVILALGAVAFATSCEAGSDSTAAEQSLPEEPSAAQSSSPTEPPTAFEGTWRAGPVPLGVMLQHAGHPGFGDSALDFARGRGPGAEFVLDLKLEDGTLLLDASIDGEPQGPFDRETYTADGETITFAVDGASCSARHRWDVSGNELTFTLISDSCPDLQGIPDAAYMKALYTSAPYVRMQR